MGLFIVFEVLCVKFCLGFGWLGFWFLVFLSFSEVKTPDRIEDQGLSCVGIPQGEVAWETNLTWDKKTNRRGKTQQEKKNNGGGNGSKNVCVSSGLNCWYWWIVYLVSALRLKIIWCRNGFCHQKQFSGMFRYLRDRHG